MASITVRDIPDDVYRAITTAADLNNRSINKEIITSLEKAFRPRRISIEDELRELEELRKSLGGAFNLTDEEINAAKREGRP